MLKSPNILPSKNQFQQRMLKSQEILPFKQMPNIFPNSNIIYNKSTKLPLSLYNTNLLKNGSEIKDYSVKCKSDIGVKLSSDSINHFSYHPININKNIVSTQNLTNSFSDLCTTSSFRSLKSSDSLLMKNNTSQLGLNNSINLILTPNQNNVYDSQKHSPNLPKFQMNSNINFFPIEKKSSLELKNIIINSRNLLNNTKLYSNEIPSKFSQQNFRYDTNNTISTKVNYFNSNIIEQNNKINDEKKNLSSLYANRNNSNGYYEKIKCQNNNLEFKERKKTKNFYNKFNSSKENNLNENTVILTLKLKVSKNDIRVFNLKKYDDLFASLEKFVDLNQINQELVKPLVTLIFKSLNRIFWLLNNKIGIYDQEYLASLYRLWIKNNQEIPKSKKKNQSDKSTNDSSDVSSEKISENIKSNSFQNTDGNNDEKEKQKTVKTI